MGYYCINPQGFTWQNMADLAAAGMTGNQCYVMGETVTKHIAKISTILDEAAANNMRLLIYPFSRDLYNRVEKGKALATFEPEDAKIISEVVNKFKTHKGLLGWYLIDEPEGRNISPQWCKDVYRYIKSVDQYNHPVIVVNYSARGVGTYKDAADVMLPDPYPSVLKATGASKWGWGELAVFGDGSLVNFVTPHIDAAIAGGKVAWFTPQLFNYAMFDPNQDDTRALTFRELRATIYGAIVHGATGIIGYCENFVHAEPHLEIGYPFIAGEIAKIRDPLLSGTRKAAGANDRDIEVLSREYNGQLVTIAVNTGLSVKPGISIVQSVPDGKLYVLSENRTVSPVNGLFTDDFPANGVHIYLSGKIPGKTLKAVETEIATIYSAIDEANRENLAYAGNGAKLTSGHKDGRLALNDGFYKTENTGRAVYRFESDGKSSGDYIEIAFPSPGAIKKIRVYSTSPFSPEPGSPVQHFEHYTFRVYSVTAGWLDMKEADDNAEPVMTAGAEDLKKIGNPDNIAKVRFEGVPAGNRYINEIQVW